jgi:hypothetical protein
MYAIPRPRSSRSRNGTFSTRTHGGLLSAIRRKTLRINPDRRPKMPTVLPACEMSWHGNPAVNSSMSRGSFEIDLISVSIRIRGKRRVSTVRARGSISQSNEVVNPACSKPCSIPPTPESNPATFKGLSRQPLTKVQGTGWPGEEIDERAGSREACSPDYGTCTSFLRAPVCPY